MYRLDKTKGAAFSLQYHFITTIKYRKQIFTNESIVSDLKIIILQISKDFDVEIIEQECGVDHIHILFRTKPIINLTKYINILKGHSSRAIRKKYFDFLKNKLWGDSFWSPSYFLATTGNVTIDILKEYIENQERK